MTTEFMYLLFSLFFSLCLLIGFCLLLSLYISFFPRKQKYALFTKKYKHFQITGQLWG